MTKYEELAKQINEIDELTDEKFRFKVAALLERELAPLVEAAKKIQETDVKRGWLCRTDNRCERCAVCELETALKGWTR